MTALASQLGDMRRSQFRRLLVVSALLHVGGFLLLVIAPMPSVRPAGLPTVIPVDLIELGSAPARASRPPAPAPRAETEPAAPKPEPKPTPPPVPVQKKVVLPAEPSPPKPKPEPKARPEPKPEPPPEARAPRRELDPSELPPAPQVEAQNYDDVLAQLRAEAGEPDAPAQPSAPSEAPPAPGAASGGSGTISPELAAWMTKVKIHVKRSWVVPPGFRTQPLQTQLMLNLAADGSVLGEPEITRRSGNPWFDEGVVRAIKKSSPLPPPPEAAEWPFIFSPEDSY